VRTRAAVETHLWRPVERRLMRRFRDGESAVEAFCEDYACVTWGLIELFQATGTSRWLDWAVELTSVQTALFFDDRDAGWFSTSGQDQSVLLRLKEDYDGAEPAAASVTVRNLLSLGHLVGDATLVERAQRTLERYGPKIGQVARVMPFMVSNLVLWHAPPVQVVVVGDPHAPDTRALERVIAATYLPSAVHVPVAPGAAAPDLVARLPWLTALTLKDGRATAYVCRSFACQLPATDPATLERQLADAAAGPRIV
jgi:uncharacterized protein YyaL (SSP411 family)